MATWHRATALLMAALFSVAAASAPVNRFVSPQGYIFEWEIDSKHETITASMTAPTVGWVGFGFHCTNDPSCDNDQLMENVDFVIGLFSSNGTFIGAVDRVSNPNAKTGQPFLDTAIGGVENVIGLGGTQTATSTTVRWQRALNTGDTAADHVINLTGTTRILYAWGQSNSFSYHGPNAFQAVIAFGSGNATHVDSSNLYYLRYWHGSLMFFAYGVVMTLGIVVARYMKHYRWWFELHWGIMTVALCMIAAAFVMIVVSLASLGEPQFTSAHEIIGLIAVVLTFLTPILGVLAHFMWNPERAAAPLFPDQLHWWSGRLSLVLAWVNIILGLHMDDLTPSGPISSAVSWVAGGTFVFFALVYLVVEAHRFFHPDADVNTHDTEAQPLLRAVNT